MEILNKSNLKEISDSNVSFGFKIIVFFHSVETDLSEAIYKYWCKLRGEKFERKESKSPTSCMLISKRTSSLFINFLNLLSVILRPFRFSFSKKDSVTFSLFKMRIKELEMFELKCPKGATFGKPTYFESSNIKKGEKCAYCGRCLELIDGDKKIVGGF